jgi:ribonuclease D
MASADEAVVVDALAEGLRSRAVLQADGEREGAEGLSRRAPGHRNRLASRQDHPHPVFDTQVAAMVLGYGDSISYDQLVQRITGDALDKSHRFTDWSRRPLTAAQLKYASPT